jgi:hypothetical protein
MDVSEEQLGVSLDNLQQSQTHSRIALLRSRVQGRLRDPLVCVHAHACVRACACGERLRGSVGC